MSAVAEISTATRQATRRFRGTTRHNRNVATETLLQLPLGPLSTSTYAYLRLLTCTYRLEYLAKK
jgi:hypothetical protein